MFLCKPRPLGLAIPFESNLLRVWLSSRAINVSLDGLGRVWRTNGPVLCADLWEGCLIETIFWGLVATCLLAVGLLSALIAWAITTQHN